MGWATRLTKKCGILESKETTGRNAIDRDNPSAQVEQDCECAVPSSCPGLARQCSKLVVWVFIALHKWRMQLRLIVDLGKYISWSSWSVGVGRLRLRLKLNTTGATEGPLEHYRSELHRQGPKGLWFGAGDAIVTSRASPERRGGQSWSEGHLAPLTLLLLLRRGSAKGRRLGRQWHKIEEQLTVVSKAGYELYMAPFPQLIISRMVSSLRL